MTVGTKYLHAKHDIWSPLRIRKSSDTNYWSVNIACAQNIRCQCSFVCRNRIINALAQKKTHTQPHQSKHLMNMIVMKRMFRSFLLQASITVNILKRGNWVGRNKNDFRLTTHMQNFHDRTVIRTPLTAGGCVINLVNCRIILSLMNIDCMMYVLGTQCQKLFARSFAAKNTSDKIKYTWYIKLYTSVIL